MSRLRFFVLLAVLSGVVLQGRTEDVMKPNIEIIDVPISPNVISTEPSTFVTTTKPALPPQTTTKITSAKPTDSPSALTPSLTTKITPKPTDTPTDAPTAAPTATPPPAPPKPGPVPAPDQGSWMYTDDQNVTCIVVQFAAQLNVSYNKTARDNSTSIASVILNVPVNGTEVSGNCNGTEQWILISWSSGVFNSSVRNSLRLNFVKNETTKMYALKSLNVTLDAKLLVNSSTPGDKMQFSHGEEWQTPLATSYRCSAQQLNLTIEVGTTAASLQLSGLQEEAFRSTHGKGFSAARECGGGDVPDAVPIAVGCALGGLVLVVLVAYLVARRRSAARGYLSM